MKARCHEGIGIWERSLVGVFVPHPQPNTLPSFMTTKACDSLFSQLRTDIASTTTWQRASTRAGKRTKIFPVPHVDKSSAPCPSAGPVPHANSSPVKVTAQLA